MDNLPPPSQLALALAIVKHKPVHLTIKEYIFELRQCIKSSQLPNADGQSHSYAEDQYFDSVAFWKRAYEQSEAEQSKLLDRIYDLERRNESLLSKAQTRNPVLEPSEPERKRAKTQAYFATRDGMKGQSEYSEEPTAPFMRHFYILQKTLQKKSTPSDIALAAVKLCRATGDTILEAITENGGEVRNVKKKRLLVQQSGVVDILHGAETSFRLLLQGARKLSTPESTQEFGTVTYHMVSLYESMLSALEQYCKSHGNESATTKPKQKKSKKTKSNHVDEVASRISQSLNVMASSLDLSCTAHHPLLEGFLFLVVNRVGTLLSLFTFGDLKQRPDLKSSKLPLPQAVDEPSPAVQIEATQLIWLLERLLAVLDSSSNRRTSVGRETEKALLIEKLPEKLQGTLLQAIFGEDRAWEQVLVRPPRPMGQDLKRLDVPGHDVPDWFIREAWRLLGWDLLATALPSGD